MEENKPRLKKNKKRSYIQRAKKFGKSGRFGKGRQIDKDTYDYFIRVMENMREGAFDDKESEDIFVANVFSQTEGEETRLCGNQLVSRVVERLLPKATEEVKARFMTALAEDLRITAMDPFASHILESLMIMSVFQTTEVSQDCVSTRRDWILRVCRFSINNLGEFSGSPYASHVLRSAFQCLAGIRLPADVLRSRRFQAQKDVDGEDGLGTSVQVDEEFVAVLSNAAERTCQMENKKALLHTSTTSGVVQVLLTCLAKVAPKTFRSLSRDVVQALTEEEEDATEELLESEPAARIVEAILANAEKCPKLHRKLAKLLFDGRLLRWSKHPVGNFSVQRLLDSCGDKKEFEKWFEEELDSGMEDIFTSGNTGVILSIAKASRRLSTKQSHFLVALMRTLHCYEPSHHQPKLVPLLVRLATRESSEGDDEGVSVHLHGSLILQELLSFNKPIKVVSSLLGLPSGRLRALLSDPRGCHVSDAFMMSPTIGEKSREGFAKALKGELFQLACSKHGARSLDSLWVKGSIAVREVLASDLAQHESALNSNQYGRFIATKMFLSNFKRGKEDWRRAQEGHDRKTEAMREFLTEMKVVGPLERKKPEKVTPSHVKMSKSDGSGTSVNVKREEIKSSPRKKRKVASYLDDL